MKNINVTEKIIYIGADDKDIDLFESQYIVPNGISYNSYVIIWGGLCVGNFRYRSRLRYCWLRRRFV